MKNKLLRNKIAVETFVYEVCPKIDGNFTYIRIYHKEIMCDTKDKVIGQLDGQHKEAREYVIENVRE